MFLCLEFMIFYSNNFYKNLCESLEISVTSCISYYMDNKTCKRESRHSADFSNQVLGCKMNRFTEQENKPKHPHITKFFSILLQKQEKQNQSQ